MWASPGPFVAAVSYGLQFGSQSRRCGVHAAFFAERVALTQDQLRATVHGTADDPVWSAEEQLIVCLADELHDRADISDTLWQKLDATFGLEQILELIALAGSYHTVSFFANGLRLPRESYAASFPE